MDMESLLKNKGMVAIGVIVAAIILYAVFRKSPQTGGTANNAGGQLYYGSGLNPQQALELAGMEVQAQSANLATITSGKVNLANIAALENVSLAQNTTYGNVESAAIAANRDVALNTNSTSVALANIGLSATENTNQTEAQIVANQGSTLQGLKPSWIDNLLQLSSFGGQFGDTSSSGTNTSVSGTGATSVLGSTLAKIFGGGGGGGGGFGFGGGGLTSAFGI